VKIQDCLKGWSKDARVDGKACWASIDKKNLKSVLSELHKLGVYRICCISGVDTGEAIDVIYHFDYEGFRINVKIVLDKARPEIQSITRIYPGAGLYERELAEMLGVKVIGHPDPRNLFLYKDSPKTPLRRS
jgi:Ni,Fe-hydrogenase III component G